MNEFWEFFNKLNLIIGPVGFIIGLISYFKIKRVDNSLISQKEKILFNKKYKKFTKNIDMILSILENDGVENSIPLILNLCDKILKVSGGLPKSELKNLNTHINNIKKYNLSNRIDVKSELNYIRNIIESVGEKNGL